MASKTLYDWQDNDELVDDSLDTDHTLEYGFSIQSSLGWDEDEDESDEGEWDGELLEV